MDFLGSISTDPLECLKSYQAKRQESELSFKLQVRVRVQLQGPIVDKLLANYGVHGGASTV